MHKAEPLKDLAAKYLILSFTLFVFAGILALFLKIIQLLALTSVPQVHSFYNRAFTMHGLIMMSFFLPPVFHAGFGYLVSGQKLLNKPRYFLEIATAGFLLHSTGIVAVLVGMFAGEFNSGWMIPWSEVQGAGVSGFLFFSGLLLLQMSRITDSVNLLTLWLRSESRDKIFRSPFSWALMTVSFVYLLSLLTLPLLVFGSQLNREWVGLYNLLLRPSVYLMTPLGVGLILEIVNEYQPLTKTNLAQAKICFIIVGLLAVLKMAFTLFSYFRQNLNLALYSDWLMGLLSVPLLGMIVIVLQVWPWRTRRRSALTAMIQLLLVLLSLGTITGLYHLMTDSGQVARSTYFLVAHFHTILFGTNLVAAVFAVLHLTSRQNLTTRVRLFIGGTLFFIFSLYAMGGLKVYRHQSQILITDVAWIFGFLSFLGGLCIIMAVSWILFGFLSQD
ncbi:cbb3-type cytochrome c oxidase subunit I [Pseudobdellovibrio sp. HCB154]|uniref:cbb3-type cytochrome c oxidase subunit I n=1 Tax=Pseudobdellovibrio sp. HCB154 TaxID=3386277 RepID=UPI003916D3C9